MNCTMHHPATATTPPAPARRGGKPRPDFVVSASRPCGPARSESCHYQAAVEYQAARLSKLLKSQPQLERAGEASALLHELMASYRQAIAKAGQR